MEQPVMPKRINALRLDLIKVIPRFPNDRTSLRHMEQKHLGKLMVDYLSWRSRYVGRRPRRVIAEPRAFANPLWAERVSGIEALLDKVGNGEDLTPHLSLSPHTQGYTPAARAKGASSEDKWSDKDFVLNAMGFHHFHLGENLEDEGHVQRTNELMFAEVTRDFFKVIDLFTHDVFEHGSPEMSRLWSTHEEIAMRGASPGGVIAMGLITTSGHPVHLITYAGQCARIVYELDEKLDDPVWVKTMYADAGREAPRKLKLKWAFNHIDLGLVDLSANIFFIMQKGWN